MKIKFKTFSTEKAEIAVVDLPEGAKNIRLYNGWVSYRDIGTLRQTTIPDGDWQPFKWDVETIEKIVDNNGWGCYKNYLSERPDNVYTFETAAQSMQSLLKANVQTENPLGERPSASEMFDGISNIEHADRVETWEDVEREVFRNPYYLFKLK